MKRNAAIRAARGELDLFSLGRRLPLPLAGEFAQPTATIFGRPRKFQMVGRAQNVLSQRIAANH